MFKNSVEEKKEIMITDYKERIKKLFPELDFAPYEITEENLVAERKLTDAETGNIFNDLMKIADKGYQRTDLENVYLDRIRELFPELDPYHVSTERFNFDKPLMYTEVLDMVEGIISLYKNERRERYKRTIFVHLRSYYLPDSIRGMTDTVKNIWINAREYFTKHVLRHELIHFAHPEWSESMVREFHDTYEPYLPGVELVYV